MNPGAKLKYEKVRKIQRNAVEFNSIAYALPPYRALVSATTKAIVPHLEEYIAKESVRTGRPGKNKIALSYLVDLGPEFVVALAVTTTVNNFHRPLSHQSLAMKIGQAIAYEWSIFQEDPTTVARVVKNTHKGATAMRRRKFLWEQLSRILKRPLLQVPIIGKIAIGNILLSLIERTPLVTTVLDNKKGYLVCASSQVRDALEKQLKQHAVNSPVLLPSLSKHEAEPYALLKAQSYNEVALSTTDEGSLFHQACNILNSTAFKVGNEQLDFIMELLNKPTNTLGIPGYQEEELPRYNQEMTEDEVQQTKQARALVYARRNLWRSKRTKFLSAMSVLSSYRGKDVYANVVGDFRGRIYPEADIFSYQGEDWVRSLWYFSEGKPITTQEQADWLYIHAANCYGLSRRPFADRVAYIADRLDEFRILVHDPHTRMDILEEAKDPFRFLAAIREVVQYEEQGFGFVSHIPVQIDASSQAIQIWAGIVDNRDLLRRSNVTRPQDGSLTCYDIYHDMACELYAEAMNDSSEGAIHWRLNGVDRAPVKQAMMAIPYGGTFISVQRAIDTMYPKAPALARGWLCKKLWSNSHDILHDIVSLQQRLSHAVSEHMKQTGATTYEWTSPCGVHVKQKYMKTRKERIRNAVGQTLYSYQIDTDTVDIQRHASAFPANFLHSMDASLLCRFITLMSEYGYNHIMPIHDCVGVHASDVHSAKYFLAESYLWAVRSARSATEGLCNILKVEGGGPASWYDGVLEDRVGPLSLSPYLFS